MGNCCYQNQSFENRPAYVNNDKSRSLLSRIKKNFISSSDSREKFIIFGQDKNGYNFFLRLDSSSMVLKVETLPSHANFFNYSGVTIKDEDTLVVCGGIKHNLTGITNQCFEYSFSKHSCTKLPNMLEIRYTFPTIHVNGKVYAIGGRVYGDDTVSLMRKCEVYDYATGKWSRIAEMNVPRCTSSAFLFNSTIWVIGGYTGRYQRSKKIERYVEAEDRWELLDFKLFFGFENGNVLATGRPNEVILLGGKMNFGSSNNVWCYDLLNKSVINRKPLKNDCILTKHQIIRNGQVCILGELQQRGFFYEKYDIRTGAHSSGTFSTSRRNLEKFKQYNFNTPPLIVPYDGESVADFSGRNYAHKNVIFGTDQEPFQLEVDSVSKEISVFGVPTNLKLRNFQGCYRISDNEVLMCGGINITFQRISSRAFIYNLNTRQVSFIADMRKMRYTFSTAFVNGFFYAVGGREYGDDNSAIYVECERYNMATGDWEYTSPLNIARCTSNCFVVRSKLYVAGGYCRNSKRTNTIETFNDGRGRWELLGLMLPSPLEASCFIKREDEIFCCAGRTDTGDCKSKFRFSLARGDLDVTSRISEDLTHPLCLQKVVYVRDVFFVFGSIEFNKINVINAADFTNVKSSNAGATLQTFQGNSETSDITLDAFRTNLEASLKSVAFTVNYMKRNAYVLPSAVL